MCIENVDHPRRMITALKVCSSSLEDKIEELKAENVRLRFRSQMLENEKRTVEEETKTELCLFHTANSLHERL